MMIGILLAYGKQLNDCIISLRGEAYKTSLIKPLFIEVSVSSQDSERFLWFVLLILELLILELLILELLILELLILELFWQCCIFCFSFKEFKKSY